MDRRNFSKMAGAMALAATPLAGLAQAPVRKPENGREYLTLGKQAAVDAPAGKIEVVDFFWYSCPHCNAFEPQLQAWSRKLPPDVSLRRIPVAFRDDFVPQQRLFYTLDALGKVDELHAKVFEALHRERLPLTREEPMAEWAEKQGIDKAKFREVYNSFAVSAKQRRAVQVQDAYAVEGVPALGVAGRYYTDGTLAGNMPRALEIVDWLVAEARRAGR